MECLGSVAVLRRWQLQTSAVRLSEKCREHRQRPNATSLTEARLRWQISGRNAAGIPGRSLVANQSELRRLQIALTKEAASAAKAVRLRSMLASKDSRCRYL